MILDQLAAAVLQSPRYAPIRRAVDAAKRRAKVVRDVMRS